jgi:F-type H+-transporting ATPase subunit gamma
MPGAKEIRTKIKSVKSTQKITKAMEKVATSKMRKAQVRMAQARPYAEKIRRVVGHLALANPEYRHPFLVERPAQRVLMIVVTSDRGLAGGLNVNMFRAVTRATKEWKDKGAEVQYIAIGSKGLAFFKRFGGKVLAEVSKLGDAPKLDQLLGAIKVALDAYRDGKVDRVILGSTQFINTMVQKPVLHTVLQIGRASCRERVS